MSPRHFYRIQLACAVLMGGIALLIAIPGEKISKLNAQSVYLGQRCSYRTGARTVTDDLTHYPTPTNTLLTHNSYKSDPSQTQQAFNDLDSTKVSSISNSPKLGGPFGVLSVGFSGGIGTTFNVNWGIMGKTGFSSTSVAVEAKSVSVHRYGESPTSKTTTPIMHAYMTGNSRLASQQTSLGFPADTLGGCDP